jgi:hypothetical protein
MDVSRVTMIELKEVLRLWGKGLPKKRVAAQVGLDPKTVRRERTPEPASRQIDDCQISRSESTGHTMAVARS